MTLLRLRIHFSSPLPSETPLRWMVSGFLQDVAVAGTVAALLLALAGRILPDGAIAPLFSAFAIAFVSAEIVWSEILIFFGQVPRLAVLREGMNATFLRGAAQGPGLWLALIAVLLFSLALLLAARLARIRLHGWSSALRLFGVAAVALAATFIPFGAHRPETARHPFLSLEKMWAEKEPMSASASFLPPAPPDPLAVRALAAERPGQEYFDNRFPLARRPAARLPASRLPPGIRPNFVLILMEGVRAEEVGAFGGNPPGLTPNLDALARRGTVVERAYSPGMHTPDAELAFWYGVIPNPYAHLMTTAPRTRLTGLPEILRAAGWRSFLWIHNGDQTFYRRDQFYLPRGFRMVDGRDFPASDARTNWGYSDRALARRAVKALDTAAEPFAAMVLTVSNHHPFQVPADGGPLFPGLRREFQPYTVRMLQTVHYTDEAVGDFFRLARARPWFARTVFVIAGDHGLTVVPYEKPAPNLSGWTELRHHVPLLFFSPMLAPGRVSRLASQVDVPETLLSLAGIGFPRAGMGEDLLAAGRPGSERRLVTWSSEGSLVTVLDERRIYHAVVSNEFLSGTGPLRLTDEMLFDPGADPARKNNLLAAEPESAAACRAEARLYLEVYPWVLLSDRSGVAPDLSPGRGVPSPKASGP